MEGVPADRQQPALFANLELLQANHTALRTSSNSHGNRPLTVLIILLGLEVEAGKLLYIADRHARVPCTGSISESVVSGPTSMAEPTHSEAPLDDAQVEQDQHHDTREQEDYQYDDGHFGAISFMESARIEPRDMTKTENERVGTGILEVVLRCIRDKSE